MSKPMIIAAWTARILAAVILLQTLFFKFTGAEEAVFIFTELGVEPWGRIALGIFELITALLLLIPLTTGIGAVLGFGLMVGAIFSHFTVLGIEVMGDGGQLFIYAIIELISCSFLVWFYRFRIPGLKKKS